MLLKEQAVHLRRLVEGKQGNSNQKHTIPIGFVLVRNENSNYGRIRISHALLEKNTRTRLVGSKGQAINSYHHKRQLLIGGETEAKMKGKSF